MTILEFPKSPALDDLYDAGNGVIYKYNGTAWDIQPKEVETVAGPQGPVGPAGPQGNTGGVGPAGAVGPKGDDGIGVPIGSVIAWAGTVEGIPLGWVPCEGQEVDGFQVPDLRERFILGASDVYVPGSIGGYLDAALPSHTHELIASRTVATGTTDAAGDHAHGVSDPGHTHGVMGHMNGGGGNPGGDWNGPEDRGTRTFAEATGISINADGTHTHTFTIDVAGGVTGLQNTGVDPVGLNLPPYYTLIYICKVSGDLADGVQGPAGPEGPLGPVGPAGPVGPIGPAGPTSFPIGLISMWSGALSTIPANWSLCDGSNGTPDLRGRFIMAAGSAYAVGDVGGYADAIVVSHTHDATSTSTVSDPSHAHSQTVGNAGGADGSQASYSGSGANFATASNINAASTGITVATSTTNETAGEDPDGRNIPPYYALAYIMHITANIYATRDERTVDLTTSRPVSGTYYFGDGIPEVPEVPGVDAIPEQPEVPPTTNPDTGEVTDPGSPYVPGVDAVPPIPAVPAVPEGSVATTDGTATYTYDRDGTFEIRFVPSDGVGLGTTIVISHESIPYVISAEVTFCDVSLSLSPACGGTYTFDDGGTLESADGTGTYTYTSSGVHSMYFTPNELSKPVTAEVTLTDRTAYALTITPTDLAVTVLTTPVMSGTADMGNGVAEVPEVPPQYGEDGVTEIAPGVPAVPAVPADVITIDETGSGAFTYAAYGSYTVTFTPADGNSAVTGTADVAAPPPPPEL
jgi:microcystin-dependent protein